MEIKLKFFFLVGSVFSGRAEGANEQFIFLALSGNISRDSWASPSVTTTNGTPMLMNAIDPHKRIQEDYTSSVNSSATETSWPWLFGVESELALTGSEGPNVFLDKGI